MCIRDRSTQSTGGTTVSSMSMLLHYHDDHEGRKGIQIEVEPDFGLPELKSKIQDKLGYPPQVLTLSYSCGDVTEGGSGFAPICDGDTVAGLGIENEGGLKGVLTGWVTSWVCNACEFRNQLFCETCDMCGASESSGPG
eukprot:TRINITY_DN1619_c0_g1_i1.p1 TRINITY_DN1619_c0_g1~~TRINITY_DN1619_c0_g1_i1.p1  ORF type:complete len:139 (+),score=24.31 TRINITY_DN1619_c0_g1_i1:122-538(+)